MGLWRKRHTATESAQAVRGTIPGNQGVGALGKAPQYAGEAPRREEGDAAAVDMHASSGVAGGGDPERTAERGGG
jgi:hypothetical protein